MFPKLATKESAAALGLSVLLWSSLAQAQLPCLAGAEPLVKESVNAYKRGEFALALQKAESAQKICPDPALSYYVARAAEAQGDKERADSAYRTFLASKEGRPEQRRDAHERLSASSGVAPRAEKTERPLRWPAWSTLAIGLSFGITGLGLLGAKEQPTIDLRLSGAIVGSVGMALIGVGGGWLVSLSFSTSPEKRRY